MDERGEALVETVRSHLATLTDNERIEFINACMENYCQLCGNSHLPCYCASCYDD